MPSLVCLSSTPALNLQSHLWVVSLLRWVLVASRIGDVCCSHLLQETDNGVGGRGAFRASLTKSQHQLPKGAKIGSNEGPGQQGVHRWGGGKTGSIAIFAFPLFYSIWGVPNYPEARKKSARQASLSHPFLCAPNASKNYDLRAVSPKAGRHKRTDKLTPFCAYTGGPFCELLRQALKTFLSEASWYRMENGPKSKNGKKLAKK